MNNLPVVTHQQALGALESWNTPESRALLDYIKNIKEKNIVALGTDEAFLIENDEGQVKAFKRSITLSKQNGTLIQPTGYGDFVLSAQGYEVWAESTGASVIFPKEVLVGNEWKPNPYAERDPGNRRILAVHARAIAFRYSSMGIPQVSDWSTIFDTPSYRMIDLLAKAKKFPQAFKVLPIEMEPAAQQEGKIETWAKYPFDESMNLWINTSHNEVITWLSQILNREKKAMDFAQTFARRNALKHLSGIQKAPFDNWMLPVLAWRPTGNNIIKWDATQYANLQDRVAGLIEGGGSDFEHQDKIEISKGSEKASEEENLESLESEVDPEDSPETKPAEEQKEPPKNEPTELSKDVKQAMYLCETFPAEFGEAVTLLNIAKSLSVAQYNDNTAVLVCKKISELLDNQ